MPGAIARPSKKKKSPSEEPDDAFLRGVERFVAWLDDNRQTVIISGIAAVLLVAGAVYYVNYRSNLEERASSQIQQIRGELATGASADATGRLEEFVTRFGATEAGDEARILLGRLYMSEGDAEAALEAVGPVLERPADHPLGYAAATIAAAAHEEQGQRGEALQMLEQLAVEARFPFQRREADAARARLLVEGGRLEEAAAVYQRLAEETEGSAEEFYAVRLGEVQAMIRSGVQPTSAPTDTDAPSGTASEGGGDASGAAAEGDSAAEPSTPDSGSSSS